MISDEDVEYENDRTRLIPVNNEQTRKLHEDVERFVFPQSDTESNHGKCLEMRSTNYLPTDSEINGNKQAHPHNQLPSSNLLSKIPKRFIVLFLLVLGNFNMYCVRMCLSVTIVAMTQNETTASSAPTFHWDKTFQGTILASLYWGYTATQIPAGLLCVKFGGTFLLGFAIFGSSILTIATPFIVGQSVNAFIFLRVLEGLFLGMVGASGYTIISKWAPVYERSVFLSFSYTGLLFGTVFANSLSGVLAGGTWGWPSVFYFFGFQGVLWYLAWIYFVYEEPGDHPNITDAELKLIGKHWHSKLTFRQIPWRYMVTSIPVWSLIIVSFTDCWSFYTFIMSFPSYIKDVLNYDVKKIGFLSSLPYVFCGILSPAWGCIIDALRSKKYISTTAARRLSTFIGNGVSGLIIISIGQTTTSTAAIAMVTIAISINSLSSSGASTNLVEIAPKYAGVLMGIVNFACNITGFICPEVVGALTEHGDARHQWSVVFYITGGISVFGMLIYCIFASAEKQPWADE